MANSPVTLGRILPNIAQDQSDKIAALEAMVAKLMAAKSSGKLTIKVSEKGALSIYGLGRFPVTLYLSQFEKLNAAWPEVQAFVEANRSAFTIKD